MGKDLSRRMVKDSLGQTIERVQQDIDSIKKGKKRPDSLDQMTSNLGVMEYGEFRVGNSVAPGTGFTGVRMLYPGATYGGEVYNLVGVNDDVLQWGGRVSDGVFVAGGGVVIFDADGITIESTLADKNSIKWVEPTSGDFPVRLQSDVVTDTANFYIWTNKDNDFEDSGVSFISERADGNLMNLQLYSKAVGSFSALFDHADIVWKYDKDTGTFVFNESGLDIDHRIESDTDTHMIFGEGSSGNVGIGEPTPLAKLQVDGMIAVNRQDVTIAGGVIAATHSYIRLNGQGGAADDLDNITGIVVGTEYIIEKLATSGNVTVKDGTNINLAGSADFVLATQRDKIKLIARTINRLDELSRSTN